jgi:hypothetical protein
MRNSVLFFITVLTTSSLLSGCGENVLPPLPSGDQTVTGILRAAELSAVRRGSFLINQEGVNVYYAESSLVNLRAYEDKQVTLRGVLEHNTDPEDLPVLVVGTIVDVEETVEEHVLSGLRMSLEAPRTWKLLKREGKFQFRLSEEDADPILVVWNEEGNLLPDGAVPIVVNATRASRMIDELSGTQLISVKRDGVILMLRFSPGDRINADRLREEFLAVLKSIELTAKYIDTGPSIGTGSLSTPCGGSAGILCPAGFFCDVQSFEDNVGKCRKI